jgi:ABC-type branched-subunit amino acid transport system substrate-binding protein
MRKFIASVVAITAAYGAIVATSSGAATHAVRAKAASSCTATIAVEAPITGPAPALGQEQLHFAQFAVAAFDKSLGIHVTMTENDDALSAATAVTKTQAIIADSSVVATVGPAGSQEVEATGPLFGKAGMAFVSGSATLPALTKSGKNPTFFRDVPNDDVQGPQDANYVINHLHPKAVLIIDDDEAYSQGLVSVIVPILKAHGITVNHQTYNGTDTGATLSNALNALVTSQLTSSETVTMLPWQSAENAEMFGKDVEKQGKHTTLFGTDGTDAPGTFTIPGTYVSNFGPDIAHNKSALDKAIVKGVAKYGPYGAFGVPTYEAVHVVMDAIAAVCKSGGTPSRANVLAKVRKTDIPAADNALGLPISFTAHGDLSGQNGFLFKIAANGSYVEINPKTGATL